MTALSREEMGRRVARELPQGGYVNLGIGIPSMVSRFVSPERDITLHSENGIMRFEAVQGDVEPDPDSVDAGKKPIVVMPGGSYVDSALSFALMRGGHLDVAVLGAFEVSARGDLANWWTGEDDDVPGVGGAMDLACGAKQIWIMMDHATRDGRPKIVEACSYPLTAAGVVKRIFTELALIDVTPDGLVVREMVGGMDLAGLQAVTGPPLRPAEDIRVLTA